MSQITPSLEQTTKDALAAINKNNKLLFFGSQKKRGPNDYASQIRNLFGLSPYKSLSEKGLLFLAGFVEGEGSINVSIKKLQTAKFGITLDPEFSITQNVSGVSILCNALNYFQTGRIFLKEGSKGTLVFRISNRISLEEKVVPFYQNFLDDHGSQQKRNRLNLLIAMLNAFKANKHKEIDSLCDDLLPIWDDMLFFCTKKNKQVNKQNQTFANLEAAQNYVRNFKRDKM